MSQDPRYSRTVSLKLSEVFSDIGVTNETVLKRRRMVLLSETMMTTTNTLLGLPISCYHFGSQTEGSTTTGLQSDIDTLFCCSSISVIQDWSEWQPGILSLLMIQDENTSPGYILLQFLRLNEPLLKTLYCPVPVLDNFFTFRGGRILMKNTWHKNMAEGLINRGPINCLSFNGPAFSGQGIQGFADHDGVLAFHCKSWPAEAQLWLVRQGIGRWPTEEMKRYCETTGCFVVPVSSKSGHYEDLEWRISTSQAERYLMFSLNHTQIRCYILMKMILKTFINPQCAGVLSSFMCKTVLFHCIQNTSPNEWQEHNLLACLKCCLLALQNCVRSGNCPHFIIPRNNLMAGRISASNKHKLLGILQVIITSDGRALLEIPIDFLGFRLNSKMNRLHLPFLSDEATMNSQLQSTFLINSGNNINVNYNHLLSSIQFCGNNIVQQKLFEYIFTLARIYRETDLNSLENLACRLLAPPLCSSLGSVIASNAIYTNNTLSTVALDCFTVGLNSDVSSGRLKLASALYCVGDINSTEFVLRNTEDLYDLVEPVCSCSKVPQSWLRQEFCDKSNTGNKVLIKQVTANCVRFLRCEIFCVPKELQYEMFRSTSLREEMHMHKVGHNWMDMAVVDSLTYLYFLQYKTYGRLQRPAGQQCALTYLAATVETEPNLGHRETALNLLGQCMEQENRPMDALHCYMKSLRVRATNNAARIHICRLLNVLVNRQVR